MIRHHSSCLPFAFSILLAACLTPAHPATAAVSGRIQNLVAQRLGLTAYSIQRLPARDGLERRIPIAVDGRDLNLVLHRSTVRARNFRVLVQEATGGLREVTPPAPETWSGGIEGVAGSVAVMSMRDGAVQGMFQRPGGPEYYVQPLSQLDAGVDHALHVVYRGDAVPPAEGHCPVVRLPGEDRSRPSTFETDTIIADTLHAEIAFDADYEFFNLNGGSVDATVLDIENLFAVIDAVYTRDTAIDHRITAVIVRATPADPYTTAVPDSLLRQFRMHWNANQTGVTRDVAHLMTGRDLTGSTIGIAYLGVVCDLTRAYGVSQSRFASGPISRRASLTAHEMGHNWDAEHCDAADPCNIMCSSLGSCNGLGSPTMEPMGAATIRAFAVSRNCITAQPVTVASPGVPLRARLDAPRPSPFTTAAQIEYWVASPGAVRLSVHDVSGRRHALLVDQELPAGEHFVIWDGRGDRGARLSAGVWYLHLEAAGVSLARRLVLIR